MSSDDENCRIMALREGQDPVEFSSGLVTALCAQKMACKAHGHTMVRFQWKAGRLDSVEVVDAQTLKFQKSD